MQKKKDILKIKNKSTKNYTVSIYFWQFNRSKEMLRNLYLFHLNAVKLIIKTFKAMIEGGQNKDGTRNSHLEY